MNKCGGTLLLLQFLNLFLNGPSTSEYGFGSIKTQKSNKKLKNTNNRKSLLPANDL